MGELYLDKIDIFLWKEYQSQLKKINLNKEEIDEKYHRDNVLPDQVIQVEVMSGGNCTSAS